MFSSNLLRRLAVIAFGIFLYGMSQHIPTATSIVSPTTAVIP